jgi:hypothetical protein
MLNNLVRRPQNFASPALGRKDLDNVGLKGRQIISLAATFN